MDDPSRKHLAAKSLTRFLLDTNACIALINGKPIVVRSRFQEAIANGDSIATSSIVIFELRYGVAKSTKVEANHTRLEAFIAGPIDVVPLTIEDAGYAGALRAKLEATGKPIGAYDLLIAAQALRLDCKLVTANAREFKRVAGLQLEDWAGTTTRP
jgi:tRNA(fMet)-specific endonuclease VapC